MNSRILQELARAFNIPSAVGTNPAGHHGIRFLLPGETITIQGITYGVLGDRVLLDGDEVQSWGYRYMPPRESIIAWSELAMLQDMYNYDPCQMREYLDVHMITRWMSYYKDPIWGSSVFEELYKPWKDGDTDSFGWKIFESPRSGSFGECPYILVDNPEVQAWLMLLTDYFG